MTSLAGRAAMAADMDWRASICVLLDTIDVAENLEGAFPHWRATLAKKLDADRFAKLIDVVSDDSRDSMGGYESSDSEKRDSLEGSSGEDWGSSDDWSSDSDSEVEPVPIEFGLPWHELSKSVFALRLMLQTLNSSRFRHITGTRLRIPVSWPRCATESRRSALPAGNYRAWQQNTRAWR
jgi:hypothetical protein